jgi:hypothetical protein
MQELLQELDLEYYRLALLLVARAELERLRKERLRYADAERPSNILLDTSRSGDSAVSPDVACANLP